MWTAPRGPVTLRSCSTGSPPGILHPIYRPMLTKAGSMAGKDVLRRAYVWAGGRRVRLLRDEVAQRRLGNAVVNDAGIAIHIDPADARGRELYRRGGVRDVEGVKLFRRLVDEFNPTVVVDVGANYGEVALSCRYAPSVEVHLVEANPRLVKRLRRSAAPLGARVHSGAASDRPTRLRLNMNGWYSGRSSTRPMAGVTRATEVEAFRLDDRIDVKPEDRLLFKIDVEGAEMDVLRGMGGLLDGCAAWMGMVEVVWMSDAELDELRAQYRLTAGRSVTLEAVALPDVPSSVLRDRSTQKKMRIAKDVVVEPAPSEACQ